MATPGIRMQARPTTIAPAPPRDGASHLDSAASSPQPVMPYTCQTCSKRKVKCDRSTPVCSSCHKSKLECIYQAPAPRRRKRKLSRELGERLARYERILHRHGLLPQDEDDLSSTIKKKEMPLESQPIRWKGGHEIPASGKLLVSEGKSRYIESNLWHDLGDDEMDDISDEETEQQITSCGPEVVFVSDPLTEAFMDSPMSSSHSHPTHAHAMMLWRTHAANVEPILKILHIPSIGKMVEAVSQHHETASRVDECLLFAIYHFAVFSMSEDECVQRLGQSRASLLQSYHTAARQALVKASFLKTTEMPVLQALVLLLLPSRYFYDAQTYWILTGVAVRIAQRMGIHRDGEKLGLPPFEVQMRRRLFFQLLPLEGNASQMSGNSLDTVPDTWDTQEPLNIDDEQIWPGMTEKPEEKKGATQMIFPLARLCIGKRFLRVGKWTQGAGSLQPKDYEEAESILNETESEVEDKFIRYCDVVNPLHFLTMASARTGIIAMRLRTRLLKVKAQTATDEEKKQLFDLAQKIIDADTATCTHTGLKRFQWHMRAFFLWGTWDSLIYVLTTLWKCDMIVSSAAVDEAWARLEQVYSNHSQVLGTKKALYTAFGRLTLKAWDANPPSSSTPEPDYIATLRSRQKAKGKGSSGGKMDALPGANFSAVSPLISSSFSGASFDAGGSDFNLDAADWAFWEQLINENQQQSEFGQ